MGFRGHAASLVFVRTNQSSQTRRLDPRQSRRVGRKCWFDRTLNVVLVSFVSIADDNTAPLNVGRLDRDDRRYAALSSLKCELVTASVIAICVLFCSRYLRMMLPI